MKTLPLTALRLIALSLVLLLAGLAQAATKYFDVNGATTGSGVVDGTSYTASSSYWSTSDLATATPGAWATGDDAVFCAGTDASGKFFKVTSLPVASKGNFNSYSVEEGYVQLESGNITNTGTTGTGSTTLITVSDACRLSMTNGQGVYMYGNGITKRGAGLLNVGGNQKYVGPTYIEAGTVVTVCETTSKFPFGTGTGANAAIHLTGGTLAFGAPGMTTFPTPTTPGAVYFVNAFTVYLEGGALDMTPQTATFSAYLASNCICQAKITGTNLFTKTGTGIWTLANTANDYTNNTVISAGTLRLGYLTSIPNGPGKGSVSIASSAILDLGGYSQTINGLSGSGAVTNSTGSSTYTLTVGSANVSSTFSGSIKGTGAGTIALTKTGSGTLTLSGANTYTGLSTINAGTLEGAVSGSLPGNVTVGASGVLMLSDPGAMSSSANLTLVTSPAASTVNLNFSGTQTINALYFGTTQKAAGTWGAVGSSATHQNAAFTGSGILSVTSGRNSSNVLSSSANPATFGQLTLTATITGTGGTPTGTVSFKEGANLLGTASLVGGVISLNLNNLLPPGAAYSLTAEYSGDDNFASSTSALSQTVNTAALTIKADDKAKTYGGTVGLTFTASGLALGDTVGSATITCAEAADTSAGAGAYDIIPSAATGGTFNPANYNITYSNGTLTVHKASLAVTGIEAMDKSYDGTTNATLNLTNALLVGAVSPDALTLVTTNATGAFTNKTVGVSKTVNISGLEVYGDRVTNYNALIQPATNATITVRTLTVTATGINKTYNGTTSTTVNLLDDKVAGDSVTNSYTSAYFADKVVANGKPVVVQGIGISGADVANYTLASDTTSTTADITPRSLTVTAAGINKLYDATPSATVTLSDDRLSGDVFTDSYGTATFADPNVGAGTPVSVAGITIGGADAANYALSSTTASTAADITPAGSATAISSSANPSGPGSSVTFTATVSSGAGTPTGDVVFLADGTPFSTNSLAGGIALASTTSLPLGTNAIVAQFAAQANWQASSSSLDQVVKVLVICSQTNALLSVVDNGNATFTLNFQGTPQAEYYVVAHTDLADLMTSWTVVSGSTNTVTNLTGLWSFTVTNTDPQMFYRSAAVNVCP